ncbi:MAG: bifunctional UDP-N-acetylmuramoyl-tripeptide:D-alanyl-D-alanine ligase/alanine racemase [Bacteroidales bacterium]|jgi:alanine racemase|nr:bifunctional UDP-N-acetylmuramoyl-tripeptide:D-alanyl-D-alanine ligase/alanine racemase [Bacteroidales bacterium]
MLFFNDIARIVGGQLLDGHSSAVSHAISNIAIDSRNMVDTDGCVFFAIRGVRHDGHRFMVDLYRRGVRNFVASDADAARALPPDACILLHDNALSALQKLAVWKRRQFRYPVVGITGSNGKTVVKEWLFDLLQDSRRIVRSPRSYNSQVGVPLSVWCMNDTFNLALFEAGISQRGEMDRLEEIIHPDVGIITNIGAAHQENFVSQEEKLIEKLKLFRHCPLLICRKSLIDRFPAVFAAISPVTKLITWEQTAERDGQNCCYSIAGAKYSIPAPHDEAGIENAGHCAAFIVAMGWWNDRIAARFGNLAPVAMRMELKAGINNCSLVNDYYNADVNSLEIALRFLQQSPAGVAGKTLILSDIRQSGMDASAMASEVGRLARLYGITRLIAVGCQLSEYPDMLPANTQFFTDADDFIAYFSPDMFREEQILLKGAREFHFERIAALLQKKYHQTQLEIDLTAMVENLNSHKSRLNPQTKMMVMVKAFSYGSGSVEVARALEYQNIDYLAVAVADEGIELRQAGIETPIIVMNPEEHSFEMMLEYRLEPNIYSAEVYRQFDRSARRMAVSGFPVHLKIETGMNRLGFAAPDELAAIATEIAAAGRLRIRSVFSHLAVSDIPAEDSFTRRQYERFRQLCNAVTACLPYPVIRHLLNSAGIARFPEYQMEMVRLGIGIYGVSQSPEIQVAPVARWTTVVSQVKNVAAGDTVGYGRMGKADAPKTVAIIPVGYADGYDRRLSNGVGKAWINGRLCPVIGNVCMDMLMLDVTGADVHPHDAVELMGPHVRLEQLAKWMNTIPYEVLTGISQRVKRVYVQN